MSIVEAGDPRPAEAKEGAAAVLAQFGVDPGRVGAAVRPACASWPVSLIELVAASADPAMALANWERLSALPETESFAAAGPEELRALFAVLGGSQTLSTVLFGADGWIELFRACLAGQPMPPEAHAGLLQPAGRAPWPEFAAALRRRRHREYLRIGLADLTRRYAVDDTIRELSALADGCFEAARRWAWETVASDYGDLRCPDEPSRPHPFTVIGMGKLGGQELNYSSDVDVVYLFAQDRGESLGGPRGRLGARAYCARVAELITRAIQEITDDGFVFRVDLRLRPDGINGPVVNPLQNALLYYEAWGQTWERTALIKARPVAGDSPLGERFIGEVRPFVYRRYLDFTTVGDMHEMKQRVDRERSGKAHEGDIKLGRGGIREAEFFVQVLQLIYGGRDDRLRVRGTLPALGQLGRAGYVREEDAAALAAAYRFLRDTEHKIQIVHERQTQALPKEPRSAETLARRMGYGGPDAAAAFRRDLDRHRAVVQEAFAELFQTPRERAERGIEPEAAALVQELDDRDSSLDRLESLGFKHPEAAYDELVRLRDGGRASRRSPRRMRVLNALVPPLITLVGRSAAPDRALRHVGSLVEAVGARTSFLALLQERPATLQMLVNLFAGSEMLATAFVRRPELLDSLVRADVARVDKTREAMAAALAAALATAPDFEAELDALRRFRHEEFLRIGINDLQGAVDVQAASSQLTLLAEVCLEGALAIAERSLCARYGVRALPGKIAVMGLGKLGGCELNYNSDLDLIFVFDSEADGAHEMFSRLVQRLLSVLQVPTREGHVYRIDTRLRPSGRSGTLVSSLAAFEEYHRTSARVWERQALIRARAVAGTSELRERVETLIEKFVYRDALSPQGVGEIRRLRGRMERELAHESAEARNIKTGRGGVVDVEFLVQMLQLVHGHAQPAVRRRNTLEAIRALREGGVLPQDDAALLEEGYLFLRRLENRLRIGMDQPVETLRRDSRWLEPVARQLGFGGAEAAEALWAEYEHRREVIRDCFDRWFDRMNR